MEQPVNKSNVILFPNIKLDSPPQSLDEISEKIMDYRLGFAHETSEFLLNMLLTEIVRLGANIDVLQEEELKPSIFLLFESIKSLYLHSCKIDHNLQEFANDYYLSELGEFDDGSDDDGEDDYT